jgi:Holliday junction resolvase-like predicted endonuclease
VAVERHVLVVCEVKSRTSTRYGSSLEAVSRAKRNRLRKPTVQWLNTHGIQFDQVRIDVVGLVYEGADGFTIKHIQGLAVSLARTRSRSWEWSAMWSRSRWTSPTDWSG